MHKTCDDCDFFTQDTSQQACPNCGSLLQFTMLPPRAAPGNGDPVPESEENNEICLPKMESMELPIGVRLTQIGAGIFIFLAVTRWGQRACSS